MKELILKRCEKCGAMVKVIEDCNCEGCGIVCCEEPMKVVAPNSVDAAFEKHIPNYEIEGDKIIVTCNHVMEEEHYIEWIAMVSEDRECTKYLKAGENAKVSFKYIPGSILYAYCNKHGLWKKDVV